MTRNNSLIETTERFYRLFQQSKKRQIKTEKQLQQAIDKQATPTFPHFVDEQTKITRLDNSEFIEVQEGVELLPLWGDSRVGASGVMIRFAPNIAQKIYYQNVCFAMVISGKVKFWEKEDTKILQAGDSLTQKVGGSLHIASYPTNETTLLYINCHGPAETKQKV